MPMTKAELDGHRVQYHVEMTQARAAEQSGMYREAVAIAVSCLQYVDGMMQYERKYEDAQFSSIDAIDLVLQYAPILFDMESLDKLESLLKTQRRIAKNISGDLFEKVANARANTWVAHRTWNRFEEASTRHIPPGTATTNADEGDESAAVIELWEKMGVVAWHSDGEVRICRWPRNSTERAWRNVLRAARLSEAKNGSSSAR